MIVLQFGSGSSLPPAATGTPSLRVSASEADRVRAAIAEVSPAVVRIVTVVGDEGRDGSGTSIGSGVIVDDRGLVLTNFHVIEGFETITVVLETGEQRPAQLVADDSPFQDVAVLSIEPGGLRAARLGDAGRLRVGDPVISIGRGLLAGSNQVKSGIISNLDVVIDRPDVVLRGVIQTDAAVNIGDSGGALVNLDGEVIGLVTANLRVTPSGEVVDGIGFAQNIAMIVPILDSIRSRGFSARPRYGIERFGTEHLPINPALSDQFDLPVEHGAFIVGVAPGSPAEESGVMPGDIVLRVNGTVVDEEFTLPSLLIAGRDVVLTLLRDGSDLSVTVLPVPVQRGTP